MKSLFRRVAALVSLSSLLAAPAFAGGYGNGHHSGYGHHNWRYASFRVRSMTFGLDSVEARLDRRDLSVRFLVDPQSLRMANQAGIFPVLNVQAGTQTFQSRIDRLDGVVAFRLDRHNDPRDIQVSVSGANGRYRIDYVALGGAVSPRFTLPVRNDRYDRDHDHDDRDRDGHDEGNHDRCDHGNGGGNPQAMRWSFQPAVIQACGSTFDGAFNEQQCLQVADGFTFNPVNAINTCELAMDGDANELACFSKLTTARFDPLNTIHACEAAFDGDGNELACMDAAFRYSFNPVPVIQSCEMSMDGDSAELACLARY